MDYRITDYGAVADGTTNNRAAIQAAVDACTVAGGGRVIVPIGQLLSGTIVLKSNVTLYLEKGGRADQQSAQCCQNMLLFYVEYIGKKIPELSEHLWEKNMEQIAEGWFLDLQEFLEVWPSVKGGEIQNAAGCICIRSSGSMSRNPWRCGSGKKTPEARCGRIAVLYP